MAANAARTHMGAGLRGHLAEWWRETLHCGNPYATRDLRARVRGFRFPLLILVYHLVVVGIGLVAIAAYAARRDPSVPAGSYVFAFLVYTQLIVAPMVAAILSATSVGLEREKQTFDLVVLTPLRGLEIAGGKIAVPLALTMLVALTSLPYATLCMVGGGVSLSKVALLYLGLAMFSCAAACFGILVSAITPNTASAVIVTLIVYAGVLIGSAVLTALLESMSLAGPSRGGAGSATAMNGPFMYLMPTTWAQAVLSAEGQPCAVFGLPVPRWAPGAVFWPTMSGYMLFGAGCRLGTAPLRHLVARRVLGLLSWTLACLLAPAGLLEPMHRGGSPIFAIDGHTSAYLDWLVILGTTASIAGAIAAVHSAVGDCPELTTAPVVQIIRRLLAPWRAFSPRPEGALAFGLLTWALTLGGVSLGALVIDGWPIPPGLPWHVLAGLLAPQALSVVFAALVGVWSIGAYPWETNRRRNAAIGFVYLWVCWPIAVWVVFSMFGAVLPARAPTLSQGMMAAAAYASAVSPYGHALMLGLSGVTTPSLLLWWRDLGVMEIHPYMLSAAFSVLLPLWMVWRMVRCWRLNRRLLEQYGYLPIVRLLDQPGSVPGSSGVSDRRPELDGRPSGS